jgi:hypothetical protein
MSRSPREYKPDELERLQIIEQDLGLLRRLKGALNAEKRRIHNRALVRVERNERQARRFDECFKVFP